MFKNILIVGLGNIGKRHLESVIKNKDVNKIFLFDKSKKVIQNFKKGNLYLNSNNIIILNKINQSLVENIFLCIVATSANRRYKLLKGLAKSFKIKYWLIEKIFLNNLNHLNLFKETTNSKNMYVNLPLRMSSPFKLIQKKLKRKKFDCRIEGGNWNMASNALHYIDLIKWITNSNVKKIDIYNVRKKFNSKRLGYKEFYADIIINYFNGTILKLYCDNSNNKKILFKFKSKTFSYDFNKNLLIYGDKKIKIKCEYQSHITNQFLNNLFKRKKIVITNVKKHLNDNKMFLNSIKKAGIFKFRSIPIT